MYLQVIRRKLFLLNYFFVDILKFNDKNSRIRIQDPDPSVRDMDPRIRIHTKMSWIRNTVYNYVVDKIANDSHVYGASENFLPLFYMQ
jgi:hypothetical protein